MSIYPMAWVLKNSPERLANRLVLLVLADRANDDGTGAWPAVETIATEARLSRRAVQTSLRSLESSGAIVNRGTHPRRGTTIYDVVMRGADSAPPQGANNDVGGAQNTTSGGADFAPEPSLEQPPIEPPIENARANDRVSTGIVIGGTRRTWKVDRKTVTDDHYHAARAILATWNDVTGQKLASTDWLAKIVMRLREHPDLTVSDHAAIIAAALRPENVWWTGPPTPSVIYGNGAQFERAIVTARTAPSTGGQAAYNVALDEARRIRQEGRP